MNLVAATRTAARALRKNLLRSVLAALGIIIAVAAVVATVSIGEGARSKVQGQMASLGVNLLFISPGSANKHGVSAGAGSGRPLDLADGEAMARELDYLLEGIAPVTQLGAQAIFRETNWRTGVVGTTPAYQAVRRWRLADGDFFTAEDERAHAKVCVLGDTVAARLFDGAPAVGEIIRIGTMPCRVVGVLAPKGKGSWGQDQDDVVLMPLSTVTFRLLATSKNIGLSFQLAARRPELAATLRAEAAALLRQRHRLPADADDDFEIFNFAEMQQTLTAQMQTLSLFLGTVALISLVVGAIGIANVMLVSVTERTREIGIRLAVGARSRDVLAQFLVESLLLATFGGLVGLMLGAGLAAAVAQRGDWPVLLAPATMAGTLLLAAAAGVVAGFYPALRAARLDPIEALRYE